MSSVLHSCNVKTQICVTCPQCVKYIVHFLSHSRDFWSLVVKHANACLCWIFKSSGVWCCFLSTVTSQKMQIFSRIAVKNLKSCIFVFRLNQNSRKFTKRDWCYLNGWLMYQKIWQNCGTWCHAPKVTELWLWLLQWVVKVTEIQCVCCSP